MSTGECLLLFGLISHFEIFKCVHAADCLWERLVYEGRQTGSN